MATKDPDDNSDRNLWWMRVALGLVVVEFLLIVLFAIHLGYPAALDLLSQAVLLGGAIQLAGALLGFLFGIPRHSDLGSSAAMESKEIHRTSSDYEPNTNLEQISDWLTKILVGVGLTQLPTIRELIRDFVRFAALNLGGASELLAFGILAYSLTCGFLLGYLATRLFLPGAFVRADVIARSARQEIQETRIEVHIGLRHAVALSAAVVALRPEATPEDRTIAIKRLQRVADELPTDRTTAILLGRLYRRQGEWLKAIETLSKFLEAKDQQKDRDEDYAEDRAAAFYNRSCYYAQIFAAFHNPQDAEATLLDLAQSVKIVVANKTEATLDKDFDALRNDPGLNPRLQALLV